MIDRRSVFEIDRLKEAGRSERQIARRLWPDKKIKITQTNRGRVHILP